MNGTGLILVHAYPTATAITTVIPSEFAQLKEGWYTGHFSRSIYTNMNLGVTINEGAGHVTYKEMEELTGVELMGTGIAMLLTMPIWPFKNQQSIL